MNKSRVRVYVFLGVSLAILGAIIFLVGRSQNLFSRKTTLRAEFDNVSGLVAGARVRLAGVDVGMVRTVEFYQDKAKEAQRVRVTFVVESSALDNIRKDSIAQLTSKGLLGDMIINVTIGTPEAESVKDGDTLKSEPVLGMGQMVAAVEQAISRVSTLAIDVDTRVKLLLTPELAKDVGRIMHSTAAIIEHVEKGDGALHAVIYDKQLGEDVKRIVGEMQGTLAKVEQAVGHVEAVLAEVENGGGILHALVYEKEGAAVTRNFTRIAKELADAVEAIRTGNGLLHSVIYEQDKTNLVQDLAAAAKIVRQVADEVAQGKGTLGGLLKDPTVYQDLKTVLGNIKRNILLKSVIRMTIQKDELKRTGETDGEEKPVEKP